MNLRYKKYYATWCGQKVYLVDDEEVRNAHPDITDSFFTAGHCKEYLWIPKGEIWIEKGYDDSEIEALFVHEYVEYMKMSKDGWDYPKAHAYATKIETDFRNKNKNKNLKAEDYLMDMKLGEIAAIDPSIEFSQYHTVRLNDKKKFKKLHYGPLGGGVDAIYGSNPGQKDTLHGYRFQPQRNTMDQVHDFVKKHGLKPMSITQGGNRLAEYDELTAKGRKHIKPSNFVFPKEKRYPIHDLAHARNALARSAGKPEESAVKKAVYAKYPALKARVQASEWMFDAVFAKPIEFAESKKWYPVLKVGTFYSDYYHGILDANPQASTFSDGAGQLEIHQNFIEDVSKNYSLGVRGTIPYVDLMHQKGISNGNITGCKAENGVMFIEVEWNEKGKENVGKDGNGFYRYFSVDIGGQTDQETGKYYHNVLKRTSLTNDPIIQDQEILVASERSSKDMKAGSGNGKRSNKMPKTKDVQFMDDVGNIISTAGDAFKTAIKEAMNRPGEDAESFKSALHDYIEQLEDEFDIQEVDGYPEPEPDEGDDGEGGDDEETDDGEGDDSDDGAAGGGNAKPVEPKIKKGGQKMPNIKDKAQMSEDVFIELSETVTAQATKLEEQSKEIKSQGIKLAEMEFAERWTNRFPPAERKEAFVFWQKDKSFAEKQFAKMPIINLGEKGSDSDIQTKGVHDYLGARVQLSEKAKEVMKRDKVGFLEAYDKAKNENPDLVSASNTKGR